MTERLHSYPSIRAIGHGSLTDLLNGAVVIQEKCDGSQFSFGLVNGDLHMRSKGSDIHPETKNKLFRPVIDTVLRLHGLRALTEGWTYRGEAICRPKHNTISYHRAPHGGVILFDIDTGLEARMNPLDVEIVSDRLALEAVPTYYVGCIDSMDCLEFLQSFLNRESILGGPIEGIVIKNYNRWGADGKQMMGKLVRDEFKERHRREWKQLNPGSGDIIQTITAEFRHERRWEKAVQRLRENGQIEDSPRDIGKIINEVPGDILRECEAEIRDRLFKWAWPRIRRGVSGGVAEWYKARLKEKAIEEWKESQEMKA